jgi:hypothetical protein
VNRCDVCGRFKPWEKLHLHFQDDHDGPMGGVKETSYMECDECAAPRPSAGAKEGKS